MADTYYISAYTGAQMDTADGRSLGPDATPTAGSDNLVKSGGVFDAIQGAAPAVQETASGAAAYITDGSASPVASLIAEIKAVQAGSGTPSPGNPRAISGFTGANITHIGKNLLHNIAENKTQNGVTFTVNSDGSVTVSTNGAATANTFLNLDYTGAIGTAVDAAITGVDLTASGGFSSDCGIFITYFKADGTNANIGSYYADKTFQFPAGATKMRISLCVNSGVNIVTPITVYPQIELGGTATAYEKYAGGVASFDWSGDAGTVYGGTLNVTTGVLTVTHAYVDLGTLAFSQVTSSNHNLYQTTALQGAIKKPADNSTASNSLCEQFAIYPFSDIGNGDARFGVNTSGTVRFHDTRYTDDKDGFTAAVNGVYLVYPLATPQTYQLTPTEVETLLGITNIWADTGDVTVQYRADTALFIAEKVPDAPTTDGTYTLTCTVSGGVATYSWA